MNCKNGFGNSEKPCNNPQFTAQTGQKGQNMNLEKYIDEAGKHYQSAYAKLEVWDKEKQVARNKLKAEAVRLTPEAATEENEKYVREYAEKLQAILDELKAGLDEVESRYTQEVKSYYVAVR